MKEKKGKAAVPKKSRQGLFKKIFWAGFFAVLVLSLISLIRSVNLDNRLQSVTAELKSQKQAVLEFPKEEPKGMELNEQGAGLYACGFLTDFYTWGYGEKKAEEWAARMQTYLAKGLDIGGYDISRLGTASQVTACEVWETTSGINAVEVIVKVTYILTEQEITETGIADKVTVQEERYIAVQLATDGKRFTVKAMPYAVQAPAVLDYTLQAVTDASSMVTEEALKTEITDFMETYFKMSTTATAEELNYYTAPDVENVSMQGLYAFVKLDSVSIYQTKTGYRVYAQVRLQDSSTKAEVVLKANCELKKEKERFVVEKIEYGTEKE